MPCLRPPIEFDVRMHRLMAFHSAGDEPADAIVSQTAVEHEAMLRGRGVRHDDVAMHIGDDDGFPEHREHAALAIDGVRVGDAVEQGGHAWRPVAFTRAPRLIGDEGRDEHRK